MDNILEGLDTAKDVTMEHEADELIRGLKRRLRVEERETPEANK